MITRPFGPTATTVSVLGQGTMHMGADPRYAKAEIASLQLGIELGLTHIDTAEAYSDGHAEKIVGAAVAKQRDRVFIGTKVMPSNASYQGTLAACERSLKRLRTEYVDLYMLHWWSGAHPLEDTMRAMVKLCASGKTRFAGVSNCEVEHMRLAQAALGKVPLACNQVLHGLDDRGIELDVIPYCKRRRIAVVGYSPLSRGGWKRRAVVDVARRIGKTPAQVALNFLTHRPWVFAIAAATRREHIVENAAALDFTLSPEDVLAIDGGTAA